jgi:hypothetical protein
VQWIGGILRDLQAFFWLRVFPALKHFPSPPANHYRLLAVSRAGEVISGSDFLGDLPRLYAQPFFLFSALDFFFREGFATPAASSFTLGL